MVDCVSVEKENGRGFFLPRGITPFRISDNVLLHKPFTLCRACVDSPTYAAQRYLTLRIGREMGRHIGLPLRKCNPTVVPPLLCLRSLPSASKLSKGKRKIHKKEETVGFLLFVRLRQYSPLGKSVPLRGSCAPESECREKPPPVSQPITQFLIPA